MSQTQNILTIEFTTSRPGHILQIRVPWAASGLNYQMLKTFAEQVMALDVVTDTDQQLTAQHVRGAKVQKTTVTDAFVSDFVYGG